MADKDTITKDYMQDSETFADAFKATPHRDCGADAQSDFSADCA